MTASADSVATTEAAATDSTAIAGVIEVPRNIDFQMDANLKQVLFDKMTFNNMNGKLIVKDGKVDMKNLSMGTMGGNVVMNGYYSTANAKKPEMKAGFKLSDISFSQAYKELDMVQQLAPILEEPERKLLRQHQCADRLGRSYERYWKRCKETAACLPATSV